MCHRSASRTLRISNPSPGEEPLRAALAAAARTRRRGRVRLELAPRRAALARRRWRGAGGGGRRPSLVLDLPLLPEVQDERDVAQGEDLLQMGELLHERAVERLVAVRREVAEQRLATVGVDVEELDA